MHRRIERKLNRGTAWVGVVPRNELGGLATARAARLTHLATAATAANRRHECREPGRRSAQHDQAANLVGAARSTMCTQAPG